VLIGGAFSCFAYDKVGQSHDDDRPIWLIHSINHQMKFVFGWQMGWFVLVVWWFRWGKIEIVFFASMLSVNYLRLLNKIGVCQGFFHMSKCNDFFYSI
jgi:hypothetical protein